ncbi:hypothetical protein J4E93_010215 [Alternaria ventricosa]|uniref:uncharacterized protein n=1 Tax=Alternaria ventricosa TaxID=1187951 RepID=UPI0020C3739E|nr:uncharacterized protein J4E93_010215 [Alternaria ventricosa]KAI4638415.1 hypothetical protein J4E93_010215 [Alternaria ventricosa]
MSSTPSVAELQAYSEEIQALYQKLPNLRDLPDNKVNETAALEQDVKNLDVKEQTLEDKVDAYVKGFLYIGGPKPRRQKQSGAAGSLTDKIAKESSDSTASSHDNHAEGGNLAASAHNSKGPAIPDNMPKAESKEDLKKRAEELNK